MQNIILSPIAVPELVDLIACEVEARIKKEEKLPKEKNQKYKTRKQVKELLHISYPTLNELTKSGKLPAYRIGGRVLYREDEIQASLNQIVTSKFKK